MMIDAHQHFWRIGHNDCTWPTQDLAAIHRDYEPPELYALLKAAGIERTIAVQSQESEADTRYLLTLAEETDFIAGVVGWTDLAAPSAPAAIEALSAQPLLKGLRPMLQGLDEDDWVLSGHVAPGLAAMRDNALCFDALIVPRQIPHICVLADRYPDLSVIIDHGAKPAIADGDLAAWSHSLADLAKRPNVCCKLSGLMTEAGSPVDIDGVSRVIETLLEMFGEDRLIWGSDWPVLTLAGTYHAWMALCLSITGPSQPIYRSNAERVYRLSPGA